MGGAPRQRKHTDWPRKLPQGDSSQRRGHYAILMVSSSGWIAVTAKSLLGWEVAWNTEVRASFRGRVPASQAGRRRFESGLPLHVFNYLASPTKFSFTLFTSKTLARRTLTVPGPLLVL